MMKNRKWAFGAIMTALIVGGSLLGCGTNDRPAQKKQDGLPMVVTDQIPEEPDAVQAPATTQSQDAVQAPATTQSQDAVQAPAEDSDETKSLRDAIYEK